MKINYAAIQKDYPNNDLWLYWKKSNEDSTFESSFWKNAYTGFRLTAHILKDAAIELFFIVVFWLIITKMSQGRDLIVSLFEPDGIYNANRIVYTVLTALSMSISMWIIPAFLFQLRDKKNAKVKGYQSIFQRHLFFVHRILPLLPFWLLASVLFNQGGMKWLFFGISMVQLILLFQFHDKIKTRKKKIMYAVGVLLVLIGAIFYFGTIFKEAYTEAKIVLAVILYLIAFLVHVIFYEMDTEILEEHQQTGKKNISTLRKHKVNSSCYIIALVVHLGLLFLFFSDARLRLAPESMILYIFSLYVFLIDLFVYFINLTQQHKFIAVFSIIVIIMVYFFSRSVNLNFSHYTLDKIKDTSILRGKQRLSFEQRYALLKTQIDSNKSGERYPIILVSGEGGGSRAGLWLSQNLINFDYYTRGKFRKHIFSMSTVSGSSIGLSTIFTFWEMAGENDVDTAWLDFPLKVYANNFIGSSVRGLLLTDLWKSIVPVGTFEKDRNSILQDEEAYYTQKAALETVTGEDLPNNKRISKDSQILYKDFMRFFYDRPNDSLKFKDRPLVFINSCRSNDGRRGIISPVKLTDDVFNDAVDIAGYLYDDSVCNYKNSKLCPGNKRDISLGQACNLSELFPLFSAPAYIDSLGSFVDGGYHENSGLKTTLDVYLKLRRALAADKPKGKYDIYILYFKNGGGKKDLYKGMKSEPPFALPIKALYSQPFQGSASYFEEKARFIEDTFANTKFFAIELYDKLIKSDTNSNTDVDQKIENQILNDLRTEKIDSVLSFPLARWLSKSVIKRMRLATFPVKRFPQNDDVRMAKLLDTINVLHGVEAASGKPFEKWSPDAKSLMRQQKREKIMPAAD